MPQAEKNRAEKYSKKVALIEKEKVARRVFARPFISVRKFSALTIP